MKKRSEALRLIQNGINVIVTRLEELQTRLAPEFKKRDIGVYDVGVDVVETSVKGTIEYVVQVYDGNGSLYAHDVMESVKKAEPDYKGSASVTCGWPPYPIDSFLGLDLLRDMRDARK